MQRNVIVMVTLIKKFTKSLHLLNYVENLKLKLTLYIS